MSLSTFPNSSRTRCAMNTCTSVHLYKDRNHIRIVTISLRFEFSIWVGHGCATVHLCKVCEKGWKTLRCKIEIGSWRIFWVTFGFVFPPKNMYIYISDSFGAVKIYDCNLNRFRFHSCHVHWVMSSTLFVNRNFSKKNYDDYDYYPKSKPPHQPRDAGTIDKAAVYVNFRVFGMSWTGRIQIFHSIGL